MSKSRLLRRFVFVAAFLVAVVFYYALSRRYWGGNSDVATPLLQAQAVANGHPTLDGWQFLLDSFWTVDVPFYTAGYLVRGLDPHLMFIVPAIVAALILSVGIHLAVAGRSRAAGWISALTLVALIGLPTQLWTFLFVSVYGHPTTLLFCLVAFIALRSSRFGWGWVFAVWLLALGLLGDLQALPLGAGPVLGAGVVAMLRKRSARAGLPAVAAALAAPLLAFGIRKLAVLVGTYEIGEANPRATTEQMHSNISGLPDYLNAAFGSGTAMTGSAPSTGWVGRLFHDGEIRTVATGLVAIVVALTVVTMIYRALAGAERSRDHVNAGVEQREWHVDDMLAIACVGTLALFVVGTLEDDPAYARYVTAFVLFGSILTARKIGTTMSTPRAIALRLPVFVAGAVLATGFAAASASGLAEPEKPFGNSDLVDVLVDHDLHRGVGPFWEANQTTVASEGEVVVRPILGTRSGIISRKQLARDTWFREPFEFLICPRVGQFEGVSCNLAVQTFGAPAQRYEVGLNDILVWPKPISVGP